MAQYLRTTATDGTRTLHLVGCRRVTRRERLLRRVSAWAWADGRDVVTLLAVTEATKVQACRACAPLRVAKVPAPRRTVPVFPATPAGDLAVDQAPFGLL